MSYEGEYLNGKRSGKEKEYLYKILLFEGEYLNDKRNGKGKEYFQDEKIEFEGEYLNGKAISGIKYDHNGNILYQFNNINGKGKEYYPNGQLSFEGEFLNCKKNGKGKEYNRNEQLIFEGEYLNDKKWTGKGYVNSNNIIYELKEGKGLVKEYTDIFGTVLFEGEYLICERNGKGKE